MNLRAIVYGRTEPLSPDEKLEESEIEKNPPACGCGAKAQYCLLTDHPVCHDCFGAVIEEWRRAQQ